MAIQHLHTQHPNTNSAGSVRIVPRADYRLRKAGQMLTSKQKTLLIFIHERVQETGIPPSFDEMKEALDLRSKSGIHRMITALEERGFIRRLPHRARALEIIKLPDAMTEANGGRRSKFTPAVIEGRPVHTTHQPAIPAAATIAHHNGMTVPLMGRIAAGVPIEAIQHATKDVVCPPDMLGKGEHFALEVNGDSMIEAGIFDGDIVIIKRTDTANTGEIVVALVGKEEATLKRLRKKSGMIELEAANPQYPTRTFGPDQVDIQGRLVGLIRKY